MASHMGYKLFGDGNCYLCGKHTEHHCDGCGRYVCNEHARFGHPEKTEHRFIWCASCSMKKKVGIKIYH